eukprot:14740239-Ditylum_brightwellii.AAC.1
MTTVVSSPLFPSLEYLDVSECSIGPAGVESLSKCLDIGATKRKTQLSLVISSNTIGPEGCRYISLLLCSPGREDVKLSSSLIASLSLSNCGVGDD